VPRRLFAAILERISRLRLTPGWHTEDTRAARWNGKDRGSTFFFWVESYFGVAKQVFGVSELNFRDAMCCLGGSRTGLTVGCNGYIIGFRTKEG
jgi:hypothetical protein